MTKSEKIDRYLEIVAWARKRYTNGNRLIIIEHAAAARYLGCAA